MRRQLSDPVKIPLLDDEARSEKVLLIGFQDQDNLGLRYLMSRSHFKANSARQP
jgi:hypothetical protein